MTAMECRMLILLKVGLLYFCRPQNYPIHHDLQRKDTYLDSQILNKNSVYTVKRDKKDHSILPLTYRVISKAQRVMTISRPETPDFECIFATHLSSFYLCFRYKISSLL